MLNDQFRYDKIFLPMEDKLKAGIDEHKKQRPFSSFTHKFNTGSIYHAKSIC